MELERDLSLEDDQEVGRGNSQLVEDCVARVAVGLGGEEDPFEEIALDLVEDPDRLEEVDPLP